MQTSISLFSALRALEDRLVLVKLSFCDRHIDADDVLPDDPASANIEVSSQDRITAASEQRQTQICESESRMAYPTSEFPMRPSFSPTAFPCAKRVRYA